MAVQTVTRSDLKNIANDSGVPLDDCYRIIKNRLAKDNQFVGTILFFDFIDNRIEEVDFYTCRDTFKEELDRCLDYDYNFSYEVVQEEKVLRHERSLYL